MKRLFNHLLQILVLGVIFLLMIKLPLFKIPYVQEILTGLVFLLIVIFVGILVYKKKGLHILLITLVLLTGNVVFAQGYGLMRQKYKGNYDAVMQPNIELSGKINLGNYCAAAESYDKRIFNARLKNWEGDVPCLNDMHQLHAAHHYNA